MAAAASKAVGLVINAATARRRPSRRLSHFTTKRSHAPKRHDSNWSLQRQRQRRRGGGYCTTVAATKMANKLLWTLGNVKIQFQDFHKLENTPKV